MYAIATSGGKDSTLALHRAQQQGLNVTHMLHSYGVEHGRVRFHGYPHEMMQGQAEALYLRPIIEPTRPDAFDEDFCASLQKAKDQGVRGIIFGNLWLQDVSDYYRNLVEGAGLEHVEMLFGEPPGDILREFVTAGFQAVVTCVQLERLPREYLGRRIDADFIRDISALEGVDPCGEKGEYHTLVYDGPCFRAPLGFSEHGVHEQSGYVFLDVRPAG